jgi:predicted nucleotidyltransferase
MRELLQKNLELKYSKNVLDIVLFGSYLNRDNYNDIDIAVFFKNLSIKEQLIESQQIKKQLEKLVDKPIHISSYDGNSFFSLSNFAREGILFYGISLLNKKPFSLNFGLEPRIQISYQLKSLEKKDKVSFHYMLKGKSGNYGLLRKHGGKLISPGLIEIFPENETKFIGSIKKYISSYQIKRIFVSSIKNSFD